MARFLCTSPVPGVSTNAAMPIGAGLLIEIHALYARCRFVGTHALLGPSAEAVFRRGLFFFTRRGTPRVLSSKGPSHGTPTKQSSKPEPFFGNGRC